MDEEKKDDKVVALPGMKPQPVADMAAVKKATEVLKANLEIIMEYAAIDAQVKGAQRNALLKQGFTREEAMSIILERMQLAGG